MVGWGGGGGVQPNCSVKVEVEVVLRCRWGCDNNVSYYFSMEKFFC